MAKFKMFSIFYKNLFQSVMIKSISSPINVQKLHRLSKFPAFLITIFDLFLSLKFFLKPSWPLYIPPWLSPFFFDLKVVFYRCKEKQQSFPNTKRGEGYRSGVSKDVKIIRKDFLNVSLPCKKGKFQTGLVNKHNKSRYRTLKEVRINDQKEISFDQV